MPDTALVEIKTTKLCAACGGEGLVPVYTINQGVISAPVLIRCHECKGTGRTHRN